VLPQPKRGLAQERKRGPAERVQPVQHFLVRRVLAARRQVSKPALPARARPLEQVPGGAA
jgi:hypothetical protein